MQVFYAHSILFLCVVLVHAINKDVLYSLLCPRAESGDLELDAILGELCALGTQFDKELKQREAESAATPTPSTPATPTPTATPTPSPQHSGELRQ